jgi:hypothetical protein
MKTIYTVLCPWQGKLYYFASEGAANRFAKLGNLQAVKRLNPGVKKAKLKSLLPFIPEDQSYQVHHEMLLMSPDVGGAGEQLREYYESMNQYDLKVKGARDD